MPVDVFSGHEIDRGTRAMLRAIESAGRTWQRALDLGCGYGPIALHLAAAGLARRVDAVDRDALAVAFCRHNAAANGLEQLAAQGAAAYEGIEPDAYDLLVCNLPAKAGPGVHRLILLGAAGVLREGGEVWLVVVSSLAEAVDDILSDPAVALHSRLRRGGHTLYRYGFSARPELPADPYLRGRQQFRWKGQRYRLETLHGLKGFDTRGWATDAALGSFRMLAKNRRFAHLAVCNPRQGHLPLLARRVGGGTEGITLLCRDLLALRASAANLRADGFSGPLREVHSADFRLGPDDPAEAALAVLNEKEGLRANVLKLRNLLSGRCRAVAVGGKASFAHRLRGELAALGLRAGETWRRRGRVGFCIHPPRGE